MQLFLSLRTLLLAVSIASAALLSFALVAQYGFGLHPCELCLAQRWPYAAIVALGAAAYLSVGSERALRYIVLLCILLLLLDAGIALYHAGVEAGVFSAPTACASDAPSGQSLEDMRRAILNAPLVTCDQAMVHFLGLSMAAWNALAALSLALGTFVALKKSQ